MAGGRRPGAHRLTGLLNRPAKRSGATARFTPPLGLVVDQESPPPEPPLFWILLDRFTAVFGTFATVFAFFFGAFFPASLNPKEARNFSFLAIF